MLNRVCTFDMDGDAVECTTRRAYALMAMKGRNMTRIVRLTFLWALVLLLPCQLRAASLKVSPAQFMVDGVEPGKLYDIFKETGLRLTIYNDDDVEHTWVLSTHRPSERGRWEKGYAEIPEAKWCWFDKEEITVAPNSAAYAKLYLRIPPEEKYYNQHWIATIGVGGKRGGGISLAVDIRVQIETESKVDLKGRPNGPLGLEPGTVRFEDIIPGGSKKMPMIIHNNDVKAHVYKITSLFDDADTKKRSYLSHSYAAIPDSGWLKYDKKIRIKPGRSASIGTQLNVPADAINFGKKWEDILLIEPDEGLAAFVRVQVQTIQKAKED